MDYQKHYDLLIEKYGTFEKPKDVYTERHRKIPGCLGGKYEEGNAFYMSARAHFIAHLLLAKSNPENHSLVFAAWGMCFSSTKKHKRINNKRYEWLRKSFAISISNKLKGVSKPDGFGDKFKGSKNPMYNRKKTEKSLKAFQKVACMSKSESHRAAIAKANLGKINMTLSSGVKTRIDRNKVLEVISLGGKLGWSK